MRAYEQGWLKAYVQHHRFTESPESFHFWTGVSTIAGALRRKVWTDHLFYQYTPNFYIVLVAPPGVATKTTAINAGMRFLRQVKVKIGPQSLTWQALLLALRDAAEAIKVPETQQVLVYSALTLGIGELGTFLRPENREYLDHLTSIWDAQKVAYGRSTVKDGEIAVENPWLNILAGTTPGWLKDNFPRVLIEGGLASRMLFIYEDKKKQLIPYPELLKPGEEHKLEEEALLYDLQQIANLAGQYKFSDEAYKWGTLWYHKIHDEALPSLRLDTERWRGYLSRRQALLHKLSIVLAASRRDELVLEASDLIEADARLVELESKIYNVLNSIGVTQQASDSNEVLSIIKRHKMVGYKALYATMSKTIGGDAYKKIITNAVEAGLIARIPHPGGDFMLKYIGKE